MNRFQTLVAAAATLFALPVFADANIMIEDAYARTMGGVGTSGAVFFTIMNHGADADRLIDAKSDAAQKVELHTHKDDGNGVMQMLHVPEGFPIDAHGMHALQRGGDHVMLMGLTQELKDGDPVTVTLVFEKAGEVVIEAAVDNARKGEGAMMGQSGHMMAEPASE
ncbi:MAG: copper chaperone PCu(A)C [Rhodobacteraceae bacterium]|nr:copper chaperone PCu(A)C [Paracoccaceae bacterium]